MRVLFWCDMEGVAGIQAWEQVNGGAPLYDVDKPPQGITQKVASIENFVTISVNGKTAHVKATAIDGSTLEEFDFQAKP